MYWQHECDCIKLHTKDWDLMRMWDSLVLEEKEGNAQEWKMTHDAVVSEENSKALVYPAFN